MAEDVATLEELKKQLASIQDKNMNKVNAIAGYGRSVNAELLNDVRLNALIQYLLPSEEDKLKYLIIAETLLTEELNEGLKQLRQSQLILPK